MNRTYRLVWSHAQQIWVPAAETARSCGKRTGATVGALLLAASVSSAPAWALDAGALPTGGTVSAGQAAIVATNPARLDINQASQRAVLDWQSFNIGSAAQVHFTQPNANAVALNRIVGNGGSEIFGKLTANGQVFLTNPNGVLFGSTAQVDVGGLVATTLNISNADFMAGNNRFTNGGNAGAIVNHGALTAAENGYIALLAPEVQNQGVIRATLGTALLAAGDKVTLNLDNGSLLSYSIDQGALKALVDNKQLIQADGGQVWMSAKAADALSTAVVNNSGVIQARTVRNRNGKILLMGDMAVGQTTVAGTLDASAPNSGNGGFVETSAAHVNIAPDARITTVAANGQTGNWLIDPVDYTIATSGGDITGAQLSANLGTSNITILSSAGTRGGTNGDINVNDTVTWSAHKLTLNAQNNININTAMNGSGNASLALEYGQGAGAAGNTGKAIMHAAINLPEGPSLSTKQGFDGVVKNYTVITRLGADGDAATAAASLQGMAAAANLGANFALGADIDAAATASWNGGAGFAPIGNASTQFSGTFEGLGHDISNLSIKPAGSPSYVGLFGATAAASEIRNIGLVNVSLARGNGQVGALIGSNRGKVSNSYATGTVIGATHVGGLVGDNLGSIDGSYFSGSAIAGNRLGGLVGVNTGSISNSYSTGQVTSSAAQDLIGGLVGHNNGGTISTSYASAIVFNSSQNQTGSLVGFNSGTVSNSYWNLNVSALPGINGGTTTGATGLTTAQMKQQANFVGWDFADTWLSQAGLVDPLLRAYMVPLTVTANDVTKVYEGKAYNGAGGVSYSSQPNGNLLGAVNYGSVSQNPLGVGSYSLTPSGLYSAQQGYIISYASGTLTINPATINLSGTRVYDATTSFSASNFGAAGVISTGVGTETLLLSGVGTVASVNVSAGVQSLNLDTLALADGSGLASNYTFTGGTYSGQITPKTLTASVTAPDKTYDGKVDATSTLAITSGLLGSETVNASGTAIFNSKNVSAANLVTVNSVTLADGNNGGLASNYRLDAGQTVAASINKADLPVTGLGTGDKTYDATTSATLSGASTISALAGDNVILTGTASGTFADKNVGFGKMVTVSGNSLSGADAGNYNLVQQTGLSADITKADLAVTGATAANKTYDGTTVAGISGATLAGQLAGDQLSLIDSSSGTFAGSQPGHAIAVSTAMALDGADAGNYRLIQPTGLTADISSPQSLDSVLTSLPHGPALQTVQGHLPTLSNVEMKLPPAIKVNLQKKNGRITLETASN